MSSIHYRKVVGQGNDGTVLTGGTHASGIGDHHVAIHEATLDGFGNAGQDRSSYCNVGDEMPGRGGIG